MNTTTDTAATTAPRYELVQVTALSEGGSRPHRSTFEGLAAEARKERIARLKSAKRTYWLEGNAVTYVETNGDQTRLEWVQL